LQIQHCEVTAPTLLGVPQASLQVVVIIAPTLQVVFAAPTSPGVPQVQCYAFANIFWGLPSPSNPQKPLHVTPFPFFPSPQKPLHVTPFPFSPKPKKPIHVAPCPFPTQCKTQQSNAKQSNAKQKQNKAKQCKAMQDTAKQSNVMQCKRPNPRDTNSKAIKTQAQEAVTCDTFSLLTPNPRNRYM